MASNTDLAIMILFGLFIILHSLDLRDLNKRVKKLEKQDDNWRPKFGPKSPL